MNKRYPEIEGDVYFSAKQVVQNPLKVMTRIPDDYYRRPALLPLIKGLPTRPLGPVKSPAQRGRHPDLDRRARARPTPSTGAPATRASWSR